MPDYKGHKPKRNENKYPYENLSFERVPPHFETRMGYRSPLSITFELVWESRQNCIISLVPDSEGWRRGMW